jgi:hypothetical protein
VIWDRLVVDSPIYSGDLIRAAELSDATVHIDTNHLNLNENTLIRIEGPPEKKGVFQIELREGNISLSTGSGGSGLTLNLMGRQVQASPGTVLNAEMGNEGIIVQVSEGNALFIDEGQIRELGEGAMIAQDSNGLERIIQAAVITRPPPNARYLKNSPESLPINFNWRRINLEDGETLRLEIAADRNFSKDVRIIEGLGSQTQAEFDAGLWYWRLSYENTALSSGQLTVADASGPELLSPAMNSVFRYHDDLPQLRFQWSGRPEASHYIIEISAAPDFEQLRMSKELSAAFLVQSDLESGTWYWRVQPVFSSLYQGAASYSSAASFQIEQSDNLQAPALELPEPVPTKENAPLSDRPIAGQNYIVQPGDTLSQIARQAYLRASFWQVIAEANELVNPNSIKVNEILFLPPMY